MSFRCTVPGCKVTIRGMTGLQELQNLQRHFFRAHLARIDISEALEWRAKMEAEAEQPLEDEA